MTHKPIQTIRRNYRRIAITAILVPSLVGLGWSLNSTTSDVEVQPASFALTPNSMRVPRPVRVEEKRMPPRIITRTVIKKVPGPVRTVYVSRSKVRTPVKSAKTYPTMSTNSYKTYIYKHESGNDPTRWNSSGCLGLGQACPASKLLKVCPNMSYSCEDAWFSKYAVSRYGSWAGAYAFWLSHHWW